MFQDLISLLIKVKKGRYNEQDVRFMQKVYDDVLQYMNASSRNVALVFPPLDVCWRYMIHKFCEHKSLFCLTVGEGVRRMVLVIDTKRLELSTHQESTAIILLNEKVLLRDGTNNPIFSQKVVTSTPFNVEAPEFCPKQRRKGRFSSVAKSEVTKSVNNNPGLVDGAVSIYNSNFTNNATTAIAPYRQVDLSLNDYGRYYNMTYNMPMFNQYAMYPNISYNLPEHSCCNMDNCMRCMQYAYRHQYY